MPPKGKKGAAEEPKPVLGRLSHSLSAGIVGMPNAGKSTFFNILTGSSVPAEAYAFCTIDPSNARVAVPDERFDWLVAHHKPASVVPAYLNVWDIAGLVKGASSGAGLGNAFLSHIRATDGIIHLVRGFDDVDVPHEEVDVNPVRDLEIIRDELLAKDKETMEARYAVLEREHARGLLKDRKAEWESTCHIREWLNETGKEIRLGDWNRDEIDVLNQLQLLTAKPAVYLINLSETDYIRKKNKWLKPVAEWVQSNSGEPLIPFSAAFEKKIMDMPEDERAVCLRENNTASMLPRVIKAVYQSLQLQSYFTAGPDEVKAWTIRAGTKAPGAAGRIHTDFERGFICAEVCAFEDFKEAGNEATAKAQGKVKQQGKLYVVQDGDIILFRFNVSSDKGKKK